MASPYFGFGRRTDDSSTRPIDAHISALIEFRSHRWFVIHTLELLCELSYAPSRVSSETPRIENLVTGLGHPEGPDVLADGSIVFVETYTGRVLRWSAERGILVEAMCGGGPNACLAGSDGWIYITQNGGHVGGWVTDDPAVPSIQRALGGTVETVVTSASGEPLRAPNDLAWGPDGELYFTDSGRFDPVNRPDPGTICVARPDGTAEVLVETGHSFPNGIAVDADGNVVWVESFERTVRRMDTSGDVNELCTLPGGHVPDGLKIDAIGNLWITVTGAGGLDVIAPNGDLLRHVSTGGVPLNCAFDGCGGLILTDFGTFDTSSPAAQMVGSLVRAHVAEVGQTPFRGALSMPSS